MGKPRCRDPKGKRGGMEERKQPCKQQPWDTAGEREREKKRHIPKALSATASSRGDIRRGQIGVGVHLKEIRGGVMVIERVDMGSRCRSGG